MNKMSPTASLFMTTLCVCSMILTGCIRHSSRDLSQGDAQFYGTPGHQGDNFIHEASPSALFARGMDCQQLQNTAAPINYRIDKPLGFNQANDANPLAKTINDPILAQGVLLSPGDMLEVGIEDGEGFAGRYIIDSSGAIKMPVIGKIHAAGDTINVLEKHIELALTRHEVFQPTTALVTIQVLHWASIEVAVAGAVFEPGRVLINKQMPRATQKEKLDALGDYSETRLLSEALRAASGIRPDAKLDQVMLLRGGWQVQVDMTGILTGQLVKDYPLVAGDRVIVPSTGCFQPHLVRPSQITPKGFRVFMSNLIDSAGDNTSAAIGKYSTSLPYGTRLLQAAVSANCVGGKDWTNAPRRVVLSSKNPITGQIQVIERSVEVLLTQPSRGEINPYLMPNDAIACYDSSITNFRDIARTVTELLTPLKLL